VRHIPTAPTTRSSEHATWAAISAIGTRRDLLVADLVSPVTTAPGCARHILTSEAVAALVAETTETVNANAINRQSNRSSNAASAPLSGIERINAGAASEPA
jgi:hypothetical protein